MLEGKSTRPLGPADYRISPRPSRRGFERPWRTRLFLFVLLAALAWLLRLPYSSGVAGLDEGTYLAVGMLMNKGVAIYRGVFEAKPPLFHLFNAGSYLLFGTNILLARILPVLATAGTGLAVYETTRLLSGRQWASIAAFLFVAAASSPWLEGFWVMTEPYSTLFVSLGLLMLIWNFFDTGSKKMLLAGVFFAAAVMTRQVSVLALLAVLVWLFIVYRRCRQDLASMLVWFALGGLIILGPTFLFLLAQGAFFDFVYWVAAPMTTFYIRQEISYLEKLTWGRDVLVAIAPLALMASFRAFSRMRPPELLLVSVLAVLVSAFLSPRIAAYHHYYYEILPPLAILAALGVKNLWTTTGGAPRARSQLFLTLALFIGITFTVAVARNVSLARDYASLEELELAAEVAKSLRQDVANDQPVFIFETQWPKLGPYVYFLAERRPPLENLFFFTPFMSPEEESRVISSLERKRVRQVVIVGPRPQRGGGRLYAYLLFHYRPVKVLADKYDAYPWVRNQSIVLFEKFDDVPSYKLVDGFEDSGPSAIWETSTSKGPVPLMAIDRSISSQAEGNKSLQVRYSFSPSASPSWIALRGTFNESLNWAAYRRSALSLWVWGDSSRNTLRIDVEDAEGNASTYSGIELNFNGWEHFILPLSEEFFQKAMWTTGMADLSRVRSITITLDKMSNYNGTVYIDDLGVASIGPPAPSRRQN